jgi:nucleoside phosphorylase
MTTARLTLDPSRLIIIVFPLWPEAKFFLKSGHFARVQTEHFPTDTLVFEELNHLEIYHQSFASNDCLVIISGIGAEAISQLMQSLLPHFPPRLMLLTGTCGGLNPKLKTGDMFLATDIITDHQDHYPISMSWKSWLSDPTLLDPVKLGVIYSSSRIIETPDDKADIFAQTQADIVDMESEEFVMQLKKYQQPGFVLRVVYDTAAETLPAKFLKLMSASGRINIGSLLWWLVTNPGKIPLLIRFGTQFLQSQKKLSATLLTIVTNLDISAP